MRYHKSCIKILPSTPFQFLLGRGHNAQRIMCNFSVGLNIRYTIIIDLAAQPLHSIYIIFFHLNSVRHCLILHFVFPYIKPLIRLLHELHSYLFLIPHCMAYCSVCLSLIQWMNFMLVTKCHKTSELDCSSRCHTQMENEKGKVLSI